jgi:hypothetical protein
MTVGCTRLSPAPLTTAISSAEIPPYLLRKGVMLKLDSFGRAWADDVRIR